MNHYLSEIPAEAYIEIPFKEYVSILTTFTWLKNDFKASYRFVNHNPLLRSNNCKIVARIKENANTPQYSIGEIVKDAYDDLIYIGFINDFFRITSMKIYKEYPLAILELESIGLYNSLFLYGVKEEDCFNENYKILFGLSFNPTPF